MPHNTMATEQFFSTRRLSSYTVIERPGAGTVDEDGQISLQVQQTDEQLAFSGPFPYRNLWVKDQPGHQGSQVRRRPPPAFGP